MKKIIFTIFGIWIGLILVACSSRTSNSSINNSTSSTTSLATSSTDKETKLKGMAIHYGAHTYNDVKRVDLSLVSPTDGSIKPYRSFEFPERTSEGKPIVSLEVAKIVIDSRSEPTGFFTRPFYAKKGFDKDLKNIVVTFKLKNSGSERVGILNENGELTDISAIAEGDENSFSSKKFYHKHPYIENGYFCYVSTDLTYSNAKFYRIPLNNLSRSAVEEFNPRKNRLGDTRYRKIYLDENNKYFFVTEDDGNIGNDGIYINRLDEAFTYQNHAYDATLYLGDGEYLSAGFAIWSAFKEPATDDSDSYRNANFVKNLVLKNEDRQNYSPILSPDKSEIFFLSKSRASSQEEPTLYKVSIKGGEPEVVVQKFEPLPPSNSDLKWSDSVFLDWIE